MKSGCGGYKLVCGEAEAEECSNGGHFLQVLERRRGRVSLMVKSRMAKGGGGGHGLACSKKQDETKRTYLDHWAKAQLVVNRVFMSVEGDSGGSESALPSAGGKQRVCRNIVLGPSRAEQALTLSYIYVSKSYYGARKWGAGAVNAGARRPCCDTWEGRDGLASSAPSRANREACPCAPPFPRMGRGGAGGGVLLHFPRVRGGVAKGKGRGWRATCPCAYGAAWPREKGGAGGGVPACTSLVREWGRERLEGHVPSRAPFLCERGRAARERRALMHPSMKIGKGGAGAKGEGVRAGVVCRCAHSFRANGKGGVDERGKGGRRPALVHTFCVNGGHGQGGREGAEETVCPSVPPFRAERARKRGNRTRTKAAWPRRSRYENDEVSDSARRLALQRRRSGADKEEGRARGNGRTQRHDRWCGQGVRERKGRGDMPSCTPFLHAKGRGGRGGDLPMCAPFLRSNGAAVNAGEGEDGGGRWRWEGDGDEGGRSLRTQFCTNWVARNRTAGMTWMRDGKVGRRGRRRRKNCVPTLLSSHPLPHIRVEGDARGQADAPFPYITCREGRMRIRGTQSPPPGLPGPPFSPVRTITFARKGARGHAAAPLSLVHGTLSPPFVCKGGAHRHAAPGTSLPPWPRHPIHVGNVKARHPRPLPSLFARKGGAQGHTAPLLRVSPRSRGKRRDPSFPIHTEGWCTRACLPVHAGRGGRDQAVPPSQVSRSRASTVSVRPRSPHLHPVFVRHSTT
ncbi:hypothetical protein EDB85DRAFT_2276245 [Lactarius pseudohatsudake]|nr:hypothetical protein EDB85DRAFT_2276245 [Lactarius pseudohatsudake]